MGKYAVISLLVTLFSILEQPLHGHDAISLHCNELGEIPLNSSLTYAVNSSNGSNGYAFCIIINRTLTLSSERYPRDSNKQTAAITDIYCNTTIDGAVLFSGLAFVNSTVTIKGVRFINCGGSIANLQKNMTDPIQPIITTNFTALFFSNSSVYFTDVHMESSLGFAIVSVNAMQINFTRSEFSFGFIKENGETQGSGGLLIVFNNTQSNQLSFNVAIQNSTFLNKIRSATKMAFLKLVYSGKYNGQVLINDSLFNRTNCGFQNTIEINQPTPNSTTQIINSKFLTNFDANVRSCPWSVSEVLLRYKGIRRKQQVVPLLIHNTTFNGFNSTSTISRHVINIKTRSNKTNLSFEFSNVKFIYNTGNTSGVCLLFKNNFRTEVSVSLTNVTVIGNRISNLLPIVLSSGILSLQGTTCYVNGTSVFKNNYGEVINALDTKLKLSDSIHFINNTAYVGPAISMKGDSRIFFQSHKKIRFEKNYALFLGGAIYAMVSSIYKHCAFCFDSTENNITFSNNVAVRGGSSIYADPIYNCRINLKKDVGNSISEYDKYFKFEGNTDSNEHNRTWNMSTTSVKIAVHDSNSAKTRIHYPGQEIKICISAYDANNRAVFAGVKFTVVHQHIWLSPVDGYADEIKNCTTFYLVVRNNEYQHPSTSIVNIYVYLDQNRARNTSLVTVPLNITSACPLGFEPSNYHFGRCTCSKALKMFISKYELSDHYCSIKTQTIFRPTGLNFNGWAGKTSDGKFAVTATCPIGLCSTKKNLSLYYSNDSTIELQENIKYSTKKYPMCAYNRAGPLCGKCRPGYTKVLGSLKCSRCSHYLSYWTVILIILVAGPATIFLLYVLNLTLSSGTINGILLYGNVVNISLSNLLLLSSGNRFISMAQTISAVFISILNCSLVTSVCFHKGLDEIQKTGILIIFPYLLLSIVMAIIIISRYSVWLSNKTSRSSVQVLVTVVHISISILLPAFVKTFSSILLYTDDGTRRVWLYDGSIDFLQDTNHIILTVIVSIAVLPLFTAYALFLVFGKQLIKCSTKLNLNFRQIYEAIHAPYKEGREYWFATRLYLLMLICLFSLLHTMEYVYLISALLIILFLIGQVLFHPYKTKILNILDCWALLNLALAYAAVLVWPNNGDNAVGVLISSIFTMLCTSIGIVVYHIASVTGLKQKLGNFFYAHKIKYRLLLKTRHHEVPHGDQQLVLTRPSSITGSYYSACDDFREPLCNDK